MLAKSAGRLARLLRKLRAMRQSLPQRDRLLLRVGAAKKEAGEQVMREVGKLG